MNPYFVSLWIIQKVLSETFYYNFFVKSLILIYI